MPRLARRVVGESSIRPLLRGAIDYAGLFPPAELPMDDAARYYAEYLDGADAWALGRFVVPATRMEELGKSAREFLDRAPTPWRLSALAGKGGADEWADIQASTPRNCVIDAIELRAQRAEDVVAAASRLPPQVDVFFEIPIASDPAPLIDAIRRVKRKAKVRTGGITADAFPPARDLARFIVACVGAEVPFKATAGLHHPLRATYRLTYAADSPRGEMFGFLNVLLAAALASTGLAEAEVEELLMERDPAAVQFGLDGASWRGRRIDARQIEAARASVALSFGSCSFTEPVAELKTLGLL